ncbi:MAG: pyruvate formate-lyase-activating protein [Ruthenibacterium sp.]
MDLPFEVCAQSVTACPIDPSARLQVHSFESLAAVDGPGLRFAIFFAGCPLRCAYCHNPDTWTQGGATPYTAAALCQKALRYKTYFGRDGGVTLSGGEPLMQARALLPLVQKLHAAGVHVAIDTAGSLYNSDVQAILEEKPMLLLDVKMPDAARYAQYTGGELATTLRVLAAAEKTGCETWLRYVVVPGINDSEADVRAIADIGNAHANVTQITLLAYHTLGVHKYEALGLAYPLAGVQPPSQQSMEHLRAVVDAAFFRRMTQP